MRRHRLIPIAIAAVLTLTAAIDSASAALTTASHISFEGLGAVRVVGDSEARVYRKYGRRVRRSRHAYVRGGHYLTIVPSRPTELGKRIVFETNGRTVTQIRAGRLPEVRYVEGCA